MEEGDTVEELLALGDRQSAAGGIDGAIHCYNRALKRAPEDLRVNFRLAEAYRLKAESGVAVYRKLAMEPLRRILKADPLNENAHEKLLLLALKAGALGDLAREYREKIRARPAEGLYGKYLERARLLSCLASDVRPRGAGYKPVGWIKTSFDCVVLPAGIMGMVFSGLGGKFKPLLLLGLTCFLFYCAYRGVLYLLMRRQ